MPFTRSAVHMPCAVHHVLVHAPHTATGVPLSLFQNALTELTRAAGLPMLVRAVHSSDSACTRVVWFLGNCVDIVYGIHGVRHVYRVRSIAARV